jgi:hypothetical protein
MGRLQPSFGDSIRAAVYDGQGPFESAIGFRVESRSERRVRERVILIGLLFAVLLLVGCASDASSRLADFEQFARQKAASGVRSF